MIHKLFDFDNDGKQSPLELSLGVELMKMLEDGDTVTMKIEPNAPAGTPVFTVRMRSISEVII